MRRKIALLAFVFSFLIVNCASPTIKEINDSAVAIAKEAKELKANGKTEEAIRVISVIDVLHPDDPIIAEIKSGASAEQIESVTPTVLLGYNKALRAKVQPTTTEKVLWYIPDRIFDFIDQFEVWIHVGPQIGVGGHLTRAIQAEAYTGATIALGGGQKKMLGFKSEANTEIGVGPIVAAGVFGAKVGTGGLAYNADALWFHKPSEAIYQTYRDYWGLGAHFGLIYFGAEAEYHPLEIYDFLAGIILYDPMNDDFATSRRLQYTSRQTGLIRNFSKSVGSLEEEDIAMYKKEYPKLNVGSTGTQETTPAPKKK
ncbi:hypothetical protein CH354_01895 [Leptospira levettii]|uniref:hypothetical protein n=1 Tax=Leptospira levettii TaxID=2023178 RepID=UPI000C2AE967|nr:hypothetical protein [Leptospira levettii]MCW7473647.1 hypothetical protein [Leptospira levettii]PJZ38027.1 hypothetical protein CH354_01895 [Leptospira levettii]PJZ87144.1 hypothetical protein CH368_18350 [Leptospira levettii]PKA01222.1 hypothetical protein CH369_05425 [Leptospira levettii]